MYILSGYCYAILLIDNTSTSITSYSPLNEFIYHVLRVTYTIILVIYICCQLYAFYHG